MFSVTNVIMERDMPSYSTATPTAESGKGDVNFCRYSCGFLFNFISIFYRIVLNQTTSVLLTLLFAEKKVSCKVSTVDVIKR